MRSANYSMFGNPVDVVSLLDSPIPQPKAGEVRIKTYLASIHNHDLLTIQGGYGVLPKLPTTAGSEAFGIVDQVGEGVNHLTTGQRVAAFGAPGAWAEYFVVPAGQAVALKDAIDDETAAQLISMPLSALGVLEFLGVQSSDWLIQNAGTGAAAKAVAKFADARGVQVINLVRRDSAIKELQEIGIANVVSTSHPDWQDKVRQLTNGQPIVAAIDGIGGAATADLVAVLGHGGTLASFGLMSGDPIQVDPKLLIFKKLTIKGFWGAEFLQGITPTKLEGLLREVIDAAAAGALILPTDAVFDLEDISGALAASQQPERKGKVLIRVSS